MHSISSAEQGRKAAEENYHVICRTTNMEVQPTNQFRYHDSVMLKEYGSFFRSISQMLNNDNEFCSLLSIAITKDETATCVTHLLAALNKIDAPASLYNHDDIFGTFLCYCNLASSSQHIGHHLRQAIKSRKRICALRRNYHRKIIRDAGLNWKSPKQIIARDQRFNNARKIYAPYLHIPYPPRGEWVVEHPDIMHLWKKYLTKRKLPDKRGSHSPLRMIDLDHLFALIEPGEDAIVYDKDSGEIVLIVYRNICAVGELVEKADSVIIQALDVLKNCRVSADFSYSTTI